MLLSHLDGCPDCCKIVAALSGDDFLHRLRQAHSRSSTPAPAQSLSDVAQAAQSPAGSIPIANLPPELAANQQYEILREFGRGGMGVVYLAKNKLMDRLEVLKVVNKTLLDRPGSVERFLREIRSAAKLSHPNIVGAYSAVQAGDLLAFAMEYVEGEDLAKLVKSQGPLPVMHACYYVQQAALGLQHAHEKQMVHRDIKPQNLILARAGKKHFVKILDFGLAKATREKAEETGLTGEGAMLGTPDYVAPEQTLDAARADIRADIYSLGCTLYYLLSGAPPFKGRSLFEILQAHHSSEARPLNLGRPEVPEELAALVRRMMAKDPAKRYQTPAEVVQALGKFNKPGSKSAPAKPSLEASMITEGKTARSLPPALPVREAVKTAPARPEIEPVAAEPRKSHPTRKPAAPTVKPSATGKWLLGAGVGAGVLLLALLGMWAGGVFKVRTPDGILVLEVNEPNPEVLVDGAKATLTWDHGGKKAEIRVKPGTHRVEVSKDGFTVSGEDVTVESEGRTVFTASIQKIADAKAEETFTNSLGMEFVRVPKGKAWLGGGGGRSGAKEVEIAQDFYLGKYEVTQAEWQKTIGRNPSHFSRAGGGKAAVKGISDEELMRFPVEFVSWDDAQMFVKLLNAQVKETGWIYRLPTEVEWEYACRGGPMTDRLVSAFDFYFQQPVNQLQPSLANYRHPRLLNRTSKVGSYGPNRLGLSDMHGNVWEWCDGLFNPWDPKLASHRVARGGSFAAGRPPDGIAYCKAAFRLAVLPQHRDWDTGLRVARVPLGK